MGDLEPGNLDKTEPFDEDFLPESKVTTSLMCLYVSYVSLCEHCVFTSTPK